MKHVKYIYPNSIDRSVGIWLKRGTLVIPHTTRMGLEPPRHHRADAQLLSAPRATKH